MTTTSEHGWPGPSDSAFAELAGREFQYRVLERLTATFFGCQTEVELADRLLDAAAECAGATISCVLLRDEAGDFRPLSCRGLSLPAVRELVYQPQPGILWQLLSSGESLAVVDASGRLMFEESFRQGGLERLESRQWVPLQWGEQVQAILTLSNPVAPAEAPFLAKLCQRVAWAWHRLTAVYENHTLRRQVARLSQELSVQTGALALTEDWNRILGMLEDRFRQLDQILTTTVDRLEATKGSIMLLDDSGQLVVRAVCGVEPKVADQVRRGEVRCLRLKVGDGVAGRVARTGRPLVVNRVDGEPLFLEPQLSRVSSILCLPLEVSGLLLGVLNVTNKQEGKQFTAADVRLGQEMAARAAQAIHQARLYNLAVRESSGIFVRAHLFQRIADEVTRARRYQRPLSLLSVGLAGHAELRAGHGHDFANRLDDAMVLMLHRMVRETDLLGRLGADSVGILMPETDILGARFLAERIVQESTGLECLAGLGPILRVGVCSYPDRAGTPQFLAHRAEQSLIAARRLTDPVYVWPLSELVGDAPAVTAQAG